MGAAGFGWIVATDFRGAAHRFHRLSYRSVPFGRAWGPPVGVGFVRAVAAVFALVGPVVVVGGVLGLLRGETGPGVSPRLPAPDVLVVGLVGAFSLWRAWRPGGPLRREWADGSGLRRVAAAAVAAALVGFLATMALGRWNAMMAVWLMGVSASLVLLTGSRGSRDSGSAGTGNR